MEPHQCLQQRLEEGHRPIAPQDVEQLVTGDPLLLIDRQGLEGLRHEHSRPQPSIGQGGGQAIADQERCADAQASLEVRHRFWSGFERPRLAPARTEESDAERETKDAEQRDDGDKNNRHLPGHLGQGRWQCCSDHGFDLKAFQRHVWKRRRTGPVEWHEWEEQNHQQEDAPVDEQRSGVAKAEQARQQQTDCQQQPALQGVRREGGCGVMEVHSLSRIMRAISSRSFFEIFLSLTRLTISGVADPSKTRPTKSSTMPEITWFLGFTGS